jgi:hypothetical protein
MRRGLHHRAAALVLLAAALLVTQGGATAALMAGEPPRPAAERHCAGIYWRTHRDGAQLCPRTHSLFFDSELAHLRWSSWGGSVARATGYLRCVGLFCQGTYPERVSVKLSRPRRCPDGTRIYSRYEESSFLARTGQGPTTGWGIRCSGETGGAGGG